MKVSIVNEVPVVKGVEADKIKEEILKRNKELNYKDKKN